MTEGQHRFKLGNFDCLAVRDVPNNLLLNQAEKLFSNVKSSVSYPILEAQRENPESLDMPSSCLAVYTGDDWVLIDTGVGSLGNVMGTQDGKLLSILEDESIRPEHIILTHAHPDHFGGLLDKDGKENFPNAPVYMCQEEWAVCTTLEYSRGNHAFVDAVQNYLLPAESQIERIECSGEILPGFSSIELPGHTPHHMGVLIESAGEHLIFPGDAMMHPLQFEHPDWEIFIDIDHQTARESLIKLAELAIELDALVMAYHFPFPGLGKIVRYKETYRWIAIEA